MLRQELPRQPIVSRRDLARPLVADLLDAASAADEIRQEQRPEDRVRCSVGGFASSQELQLLSS